MHSPTTTVRSWPALALAVFFAVVTGWTLLDDVIAGRSPFTVAHLSSIAALVAALGALHYAIPAIRSGAIVAGLLLALSGVTALGYVVIASGMRNDQLVGDKAASAEHVNAQRESLLKMRREAEYILAACPAGAPKSDLGRRCGLREVMAAECRTGKGTKCDGTSYSVRTYEAAIDGYNAKLARLGPEVNPRAGYERSAAFLAALPYVTAPPEAIAAALERLMPRAPVIVIELAGLAFALFAFGHRRGPKVRSNGSAAAPAGRSEASEADMGIPMSDRPAKRTETRTQAQRPDGPKVRKQATGRSGSTGQRRGPSGGQSATTREQAEADLLTLLALGQSVPSQRTLAERWDRPKQTVSDWLTTWEADGLIPSRRQVGREKMLAGQAKARAVA